ncbi:hypothetical protein KY284_034316 [Solanum tuberosum]|nr:hypothetical protein KY284_034316 [Solanum tuberosum]
MLLDYHKCNWDWSTKNQPSITFVVGQKRQHTRCTHFVSIIPLDPKTSDSGSAISGASSNKGEGNLRFYYI